MTGLVRTVLGDIAPERLGLTYAHEHLVLHNALIEAAFPHILLDDVDVATSEVRRCADTGVATMLDAMPCAAGRDAVRLAEISRRTGVHLLTVTGLHHERYYGRHHWTSRVEPEVLADLFVHDLLTGVDAYDYTGPVVDRTPHRAGAIKVATGGPALTARDRLLVTAAATAHLRTGAPVLTHCEGGAGGVEQVAALVGHGVPAEAILLSHVDKVVDPGYHRELASTGAYLLYDQALRHCAEERPPTARLVAQAAAEGYLDQVLLGTDAARRDLWHGYGGAPGLDWLAAHFPACLAACGVTDAQAQQVLVANPARALAWRPAPDLRRDDSPSA